MYLGSISGMWMCKQGNTSKKKDSQCAHKDTQRAAAGQQGPAKRTAINHNTTKTTHLSLCLLTVSPLGQTSPFFLSTPPPPPPPNPPAEYSSTVLFLPPPFASLSLLPPQRRQANALLVLLSPRLVPPRCFSLAVPPPPPSITVITMATTIHRARLHKESTAIQVEVQAP